MEVKEVRVVRKRTNCVRIEDNTVYCAEFRVGSAPEKEGTVMDISWEGAKHLGGLGRTTKRHYLNISPEQTRILWMKKDHKTLKKEFKKCKQNYENTDFKHCMKMYENGGDKLTRNWSIRFLSEHDFEIINQIERGNEDRFYNECGGGFSMSGHTLQYTKKERPDDFQDFL